MSIGQNNDTGSKYKDAATRKGPGELARAFAATGVDFADPAREPELDLKPVDNSAGMFQLGSKTGEINRLQLSMQVSSGTIDASQASVMLSSAASAVEALARKEEKEKREREHSDRVFRALMDQYNWHKDQEKMHKEVADLFADRAERLRRGEKPGLDPKLVEKIKEHEREYGEKIDPNNPEHMDKLEKKHRTKEKEHVRAQEKIIEEHPGFEKRAQEINKMSSDKAVQTYKNITQSEGEIAGYKTFAELKNDKVEEAIIKSKNFNDEGNKIALDSAHVKNSEDFFNEEITIGVTNPVKKGDATKSFALVASATEVEIDPGQADPTLANLPTSNPNKLS